MNLSTKLNLGNSEYVRAQGFKYNRVRLSIFTVLSMFLGQRPLALSCRDYRSLSGRDSFETIEEKGKMIRVRQS